MSKIDPIMKANIVKRIKKIESDFNVEILLAIESGSRAWGFESTDSDYDVRFIYKHELKWYLNVLPKRDVIELPIDALDDYSGWDIRKAIFLMNKSNPVLFEWLKSPIVYKKDQLRYELLVEAANKYFSPISSIYHYLHMAKGNDREYLQGDNVKIKKYFYVLRPILACMWIKEKNESPPMEFDQLMTLIEDPQLKLKIDELLVRKKSGIEMGIEPSIPEIRNFIGIKFAELEEFSKDFDPKEKPNVDCLDELLWKLLN